MHELVAQQASEPYDINVAYVAAAMAVEDDKRSFIVMVSAQAGFTRKVYVARSAMQIGQAVYDFVQGVKSGHYVSIELFVFDETIHVLQQADGVQTWGKMPLDE